ncbi:MAG: S1 RNA-binding domain-containing protein [Lachnospiraceae bacterium]|nr:S1 RNA-binding domain-containing protein [Lachnospiraceae bacterium]
MADLENHFDDASPWNIVKRYMQDKTKLTVTIEGVVNGGAVTTIEGLRAFIPASHLSLSYVEDLTVFLTKEIEVRVIEADQSNNRLVISAKSILRETEKAEKEKQIRNIQVGTVTTGTIETLQNYGAFVKLENGLSGLIHVSQISHKRIKAPGDVLKLGDEVKVKIIGVKDGKISLSIKALEENTEPNNEYTEKVDIPKSENIGTSLGDLFKNIKL